MGVVIEFTRGRQGLELEKALKVRQAFIDSLSGEKKEKALELQKQIYEKLKNAGSQHNRLVVINQMMMEKVSELGRECRKLTFA